MTWFECLILALMGLKWATQIWLEWLNEQSVLKQSSAVPEALTGVVDPGTYKLASDYTLAKSKLSKFELSYQAAVLGAVLFSGILPWFYQRFRDWLGGSSWSMACFLFSVGVTLSISNLPLDWYNQFSLEERFGFNRSTQGIWWSDRSKGFGLAVLLGFSLLVLILFLVGWAGTLWWIWAWGVLMCFQLILAVLAPVLILPLFNKLTPLPEGSLKDRLTGLAQRTAFSARSIQVMDGSRRSRHSNAFFTGFGRFRKIVLFDTLVQQLLEPELEAVLAHEIGHYKRKHVPKMLLGSALGSLLGFYVLSWLAKQPWFCSGFGFPSGHFAPALLLFGLLAGLATFWVSPFLHWWSRRYEYQADRFAARIMGGATALSTALRKLNEKNLSNLTPHPWYSRFYYSHPTLLERERALQSWAN